MKGILTAATIALVTGLVSVAALAEDFTFNVPVELHNIPADIKTFTVTVAVYDRAPDSRGHRPSESMIGYGTALTGNMPTIPIVGGEYDDTMTIKFNAIPRRPPETAILYEMHLLLQGPPGYDGGAAGVMALDGPYPYDPTKPLQHFLTGPIQQPAQQPARIKQIPTEILKRIR